MNVVLAGRDGVATYYLAHQLQRAGMLDHLVLEAGGAARRAKLRRMVRRQTEFRIDNGRINVADRQVFERDPQNMLRFFVQAERTGSTARPDVPSRGLVMSDTTQTFR